MSRISLVVADNDEEYLETFSNLVMSKYSKRFQVVAYSCIDSLQKYLLSNVSSTNIVLISPQLYSKDLLRHEKILFIMLAHGEEQNAASECKAINKYQHIDRIISGVLKLYSEMNAGVRLTAVSKTAGVICFFSPSGGVGKTTLAISLCMEMSRKGQTVFYLNLESTSSVDAFLKTDNSQNLSNLIFYLKEKSPSLGLRIEGIKSIDTGKSIHFFLPPDSALEMEELEAEDSIFLLEEFRKLGSYDAIVVDMNSNVDSKSIAIMEACDAIVVVCTEDAASGVKNKAFIKALESYGKNTFGAINEKFYYIVNKSTLVDSQHVCEESGHFIENAIKLPYLKELSQFNDIESIMGIDNGFKRGIRKLWERLEGDRYGSQPQG